MVNNAAGTWIGYGVGDTDPPNAVSTDPNYQAVTLLTTKLHDKYAWARSRGVVVSSTYDVAVAGTIEEFCTRTGLPVVRDPDGYAVATLAVRKRLGSYPPPAPILPLFFTVEGHMSDMWRGPVADTASLLEKEGRCHHMPTGYNNGALPFDNASGVSELARRVGQTVQDNGVAFPAGTKWVLGQFSQGDIVGFDFYVSYLLPGQTLAWRTPDLLGVLAYGPPTRPTGSVAPWAAGWGVNPGTHGLDPTRRWGINGFPAKPANVMHVVRGGDIFGENDDSMAGQVAQAVYLAVARGDFTGDPHAVVPLIAKELSAPLDLVLGIFLEIVNGIKFLATDPNPHYSPYDIDGGVDWCRGLLQGAAA